MLLAHRLRNRRFDSLPARWLSAKRDGNGGDDGKGPDERQQGSQETEGRQAKVRRLGLQVVAGRGRASHNSTDEEKVIADANGAPMKGAGYAD